MKSIQPPAAATWLLKHGTLGQENDALAGDLREEFQSGRTAGWYWSQVLRAIALGWLRTPCPSALAFAILWSMGAPSWYVFTDKVQNDSGVFGWMSSFAFPWSMIGYFAWELILPLAFIWVGSGLFLLSQHSFLRKGFNPHLRRRILVTIVVYIATVAGMCTLSLFLRPGPGVDRRTLTLFNAITDLRMYAMEARISSFITLVLALGAGTSQQAKRRLTAP
jgi:hypothetical protein